MRKPYGIYEDIQHTDDYKDMGATVSEKKSETDPSLKPPKQWFEKMVARLKAADPRYSEDKIRKTIGDIWYNKMSKEKKKEIRGSEGKTYGKHEVAERKTSGLLPTDPEVGHAYESKQLKEKDIKHENGEYWVADLGDSYSVMKNGITHSESDSHYAHDEDGLSIAKARCDYLAKNSVKKNETLEGAQLESKQWIIKDWAGNLPFGSEHFPSFEEADEFLTDFIEKKYPKTRDDENEFSTERGEYEIVNNEDMEESSGDLKKDDYVKVISGQVAGKTGVFNRAQDDSVNVFLKGNDIGIWFNRKELKKIGSRPIKKEDEINNPSGHCESVIAATEELSNSIKKVEKILEAVAAGIAAIPMPISSTPLVSKFAPEDDPESEKYRKDQKSLEATSKEEIEKSKKEVDKIYTDVAKAGEGINQEAEKSLKIENDLTQKKSPLKEGEISDDEVIEDLVKSLGEEHRDEIKESLKIPGGRYDSYSQESGSFKADGTEYNLFTSDDAAEKTAIEMVEQDIDNEPEMFNKDFIQQHIYISPTDKRIIALEEAEASADGEEFESDEAKEEWVEKKAEEIEKALEHPIEHFVNEQGIYTVEELMKMPFIQIGTKEAAKEAVNIDGWAHFLSHYDGNYETTEHGIVYFRED